MHFFRHPVKYRDFVPDKLSDIRIVVEDLYLKMKSFDFNYFDNLDKVSNVFKIWDVFIL